MFSRSLIQRGGGRGAGGGGGKRQVHILEGQRGMEGCTGGGCLSFQTLRPKARQSPEHTEVCL